MSDDFLSRWSRRKLEARRAPEEPAPSPASDPEPSPEPEAELSEEEVAALPPIEELDAESDFSIFLRRGVPEKLRNAALRRMWSVDPAIREAIGDARDYAYDWNSPGGVPGNGPLAADEAEGLLQSLLGTGPAAVRDRSVVPVSDPVRRDDPAGTADAEGRFTTEAEEGAASEPEACDHPFPNQDDPAGRTPADESDPLLPLRSADPASNKSREDPSRMVRQQRHGGAKPV